ncbi:carbon-nitrogen hydrolase family protein [Priestia megaterium]|uniref:carbon-nitrogen hydrolase family protein n=1 Tax=Priestia megaterium TaxID=1404 RepID=UPI002282896A|nr:carbon-nitrogen hydrolase family protein [Priestia megaterium]MCY9024757.1 carbon-nitrogen hydrolase family protein [Priestia megaterium]
MKIGLAQVRFPKSAAEGVETVENCMKQAAEEGCNLVCFPESIVPGLRGVGFEVETYNHEIQQNTLYKVKLLAKQLKLNVILPLEWRDELGMHLTAFVIDENGKELGYQTKNQIDPAEDKFSYKPGNGRQLFEISGVKLGIVICHEGWRYPETVRWAAVRGASIVFHPQFTGEVPDPKFYDYAMVARSTENGIYFASVNYALENQKSTTSLLSPRGECLIKAKAEKQELLTYTIEPGEANRLLAQRLLSNLLL